MTNPAGWLSVCETGGCLEILVQGDTVVLRETSTPDVEVVTTLASWQAWQDKAREPLLADFKTLAAEVDTLHAIIGDLRLWVNEGVYAKIAADRRSGKFADVAANHD